MDLLQNQVTALNNKVGALQQLVEQLGNQTAEILAELQVAKEDRNTARAESKSNRFIQPRRFDEEMGHKDVLSDFTYPETESHGGDKSLSPEVQIQRLTAQLTAAYNRIAALEEQLLARRVH